MLEILVALLIASVVMVPQRLWVMCRAVFELGTTQVVATGGLVAASIHLTTGYLTAGHLTAGLSARLDLLATAPGMILLGVLAGLFQADQPEPGSTERQTGKLLGQRP